MKSTPTRAPRARSAVSAPLSVATSAHSVRATSSATLPVPTTTVRVPSSSSARSSCRSREHQGRGSRTSGNVPCAEMRSNVSDSRLDLGWSGTTSGVTCPRSRTHRSRTSIRYAKPDRGCRQRQDWTGPGPDHDFARRAPPFVFNAAGRRPLPSSGSWARSRKPLDHHRERPRTAGCSGPPVASWTSHKPTEKQDRSQRTSPGRSCPPTTKSRARQPGAVSPPTGRLPCRLTRCAFILDPPHFRPGPSSRPAPAATAWSAHALRDRQVGPNQTPVNSEAQFGLT